MGENMAMEQEGDIFDFNLITLRFEGIGILPCDLTVTAI